TGGDPWRAARVLAACLSRPLAVARSHDAHGVHRAGRAAPFPHAAARCDRARGPRGDGAAGVSALAFRKSGRKAEHAPTQPLVVGGGRLVAPLPRPAIAASAQTLRIVPQVAAWRDNITGILKGPSVMLWNVSKG